MVAARAEFGEAGADEPDEIPHDEALALLNACLRGIDLSVWVVLDRLDGAFQGFPAAEIPALRALLRTYLDLNAFERLRLKLFVRKDLFRRVTAGGFVNLTHVNARKIEILWDEDDLYSVIIRRIRENTYVLSSLGLEEASDDAVFGAVFPDQVDAGLRKPPTWTWMMSRIGDGSGVRPPRNLIDLTVKAREAQLRRDERGPGEAEEVRLPLIQSGALKRGLTRLSTERVQDTLLAEAGDYARLIEAFRGGKAEHNDQTLATTLGLEGEDLQGPIRILVELGFLEPIGANHKIPILYREGLDITQGKAFRDASPEEDSEE